ncbi:uncharacterized protein [Diabrotica undecimpunctata]|uniref:uncharacterized protein n=1 Tax=Diabrotica undecimpunctata TaxID=50387 RepID=UPI003B63544C
MKYLYLVFIACIFTYVSGSQTQLKNQQQVCACQDVLNTIYNDLVQQEACLNQTITDICQLETELNEIDDIIDKQEDALVDISAELAALTVTKNYINRLLNDGRNVLQCIIDNLNEIAEGIEENNNNDADGQQCQINDILSVSWQVEECKNGNSCPAPA